MEPFLVANKVFALNYPSVEYIRKTTVAESRINRSGWPMDLFLFTNIEQDCSISRYAIQQDENYVIPANTYYIEDDEGTSFDKRLYDVLFFLGNSLTVRTINEKAIQYDTSTLIKNMNVRSSNE